MTTDMFNEWDTPAEDAAWAYLANDSLSHWDSCWQTGDKARFMALQAFTVYAPAGYFEIRYDVQPFEILDCTAIICVDGEATFDFTRLYEDFTLNEDDYDKVMYLP